MTRKVSALTRRHALERARRAMPLEPAERYLAWNRLERDFGYPTAAQAWREARVEAEGARSLTARELADHVAECEACQRVLATHDPHALED